MMIRYPSSSPAPVNTTAAAANPFDTTATIVGSVALGALGISSVAVLFQFLKKVPQAPPAKEEELPKEQPKEQMPDSLTYLCINTADLEDVKLLLHAFNKQFHILPKSVNLTAAI